VTVCISPVLCDAVLFDLDGVLTATAATHAACWKRMFDGFLHTYAERTGTPQAPFDLEHDYLRYIDGRPRYDGVRTFLASRAISLPEGQLDDPPSADTVLGLGNRKNALFRDVLREQPPAVYEGSLALVRSLHARGLRTAVVSGSRNAALVLEAAGISSLFAARVDGSTAAELGLVGKPAPDTFLEAARRLDVAPERAAVIEDAESGVAAARAGRFGLVIGVARSGNAAALHASGADYVVRDLDEVIVADPTEAPDA
jgi:beta-phosphoglucomutase family hydrolase